MHYITDRMDGAGQGPLLPIFIPQVAIGIDIGNCSTGIYPVIVAADLFVQGQYPCVETKVEHAVKQSFNMLGIADPIFQDSSHLQAEILHLLPPW